MSDISQSSSLLSEILPFVQPAISTAVGAVLATLFMRKNISKAEFEKLKQAKFADIANRLLEDGHMTYLEYYKCKNFTEVAEKADKVFPKIAQPKQHEENNTEDKPFNIDWFIRFYESAGNISDDDMQNLWARLLAGEVSSPGKFSLRAMDTLRNMSKEEAECLMEMAKWTISKNKIDFLCSNTIMKHQLFQKAIVLENSGILNLDSSRTVNGIAKPDAFLLAEGNLCIKANIEVEAHFKYSVYFYTQVGVELLKLIDQPPSDECILECFRAIQKKLSHLNLTIHNVLNRDGDTLTIQVNPI